MRWIVGFWYNKVNETHKKLQWIDWKNEPNNLLIRNCAAILDYRWFWLSKIALTGFVSSWLRVINWFFLSDQKHRIRRMATIRTKRRMRINWRFAIKWLDPELLDCWLSRICVRILSGGGGTSDNNRHGFNWRKMKLNQSFECGFELISSNQIGDI